LIFKHFSNINREIHGSLKFDKNIGHLLEEHYKFLIMSHSVLLRMRNISEKYKENRNKYFIFNDIFSSKIVPFVR